MTRTFLHFEEGPRPKPKRGLTAWRVFFLTLIGASLAFWASALLTR